MKIARILVVLIAAIIFAGCKNVEQNLKIQESQQANPWTNLNLYDNPDNFQFAIVADRNGGARPGVFENAVDKLNLLRPEFVMSIGDFIGGYTNDANEINRQWDEFDGFVKKLQMPFFYLPGNHDIDSNDMTKIWEKRLGPTYYHFVYHNTLFLCVNTEDPTDSKISDRQLAYFEKVLKDNQNVRWTMIFMHKPMWQKKLWEKENWDKFEALLAHRPYTVFAGHSHRYQKTIRNGQRYYVLATTGALQNKKYGEVSVFDHIVWITMTDDGPVMTNLMLDGIYDDDPPKERASKIQGSANKKKTIIPETGK